MMALLSWQCRRSTSPFACGWYDEVWWSLMPRILVVADQTSEVKCAPRSLASGEGMPKPATQCEIKAVAQDKVAASLIGAASGQRVTQSTVVRKNRCLCDGGKGPTRSMLTWSNRWVVSGYGSQGALTWRCTLAFWQPHSALPTSRPVCGGHAKRTLKQSTFALFESKDVKVHGWHQKLVCVMRGVNGPRSTSWNIA